MLEKLFDFIKNSDSTQEQFEAKIDLMLLMMFVDRNIAQEERDMIKEQTEGVEWSNTEYHMELYIDKTIAEVREVVSDDEKTADFIVGIAKRLPDDESRLSTLHTITELMSIDSDIDANEKSLLETIEAIFANN